MDCSLFFKSNYGSEPDFIFFCPYRICPLGAHVDHNHGLVTGWAINKGIYSAFSPDTRGFYTVTSMQYPGTVKWSVSEISSRKGDWADYFRGASKIFEEAYHPENGILFCIDGELLTGGLSSSAAVTLSFIYALAKVNNLTLSDYELISLARRTEREFVGVNSGILDQSCEMYCKKDSLLFLDTENMQRENIVSPSSYIDENFDIVLFFPSSHRTLAGSGYNNRVQELRDAADLLAHYSGMEWKNEIHNMREIPYPVFEKYGSELPLTLYKRASHFFTENERVNNGVKAWRKGDFVSFASYVTESGRSSINNWESGSSENIILHNILEETTGVLGSRFSGAGFNGCTFALLEKGAFDDVSGYVCKKFADKTKICGDGLSCCLCLTADGIYGTINC